MKKINYLILNYNMPDETDGIYNKLVSDGIDADNIFIVDNGSDRAEKHKNTRIFVDKNEFAPSGIRAGFNYLLDNAQTDYYVLINLSAKLYDNHNYKNSIKQTILLAEKQIDEFSYITASATGEKAYNSDLEHNPNKNIIWHSDDTQLIITIYSKKFVEMLKENNYGCFHNEPHQRGYSGFCLQKYLSYKLKLPFGTSHLIHYEWLANQTHKKGMATESVTDYQHIAKVELRRDMAEKFGIFWQWRFFFMRIKAIKDLNKKSPNAETSKRIITARIFKHMVRSVVFSSLKMYGSTKTW